MEFPIYARHPDCSVYYQVLSRHHFKELRRLGPDRGEESTFILTEIHAEDYSTALYINDLLTKIMENALIRIQESEFRELEQLA